MTVPLRLLVLPEGADGLDRVCGILSEAGLAIRVDRPEGVAALPGLLAEGPSLIVAAPGVDGAARRSPPAVLTVEAEGAEQLCGLLRSRSLGVIEPERPAAGPERARLAELIDALGHELRNALGAITNAVEVLAFQAADVPLTQRRTIEFLDGQCRRMVGLVEACGELGQVVAGRGDRRREVLGLAELLDNAVRWARDAGGGLGPGFELELDPAVGRRWVELDARRFERLVAHAVSYVRRVAARTGPVRLRVATEGTALELRVAAEPAEGESVVAGPAAVLDAFLVTAAAERLGGAAAIRPAAGRPPPLGGDRAPGRAGPRPGHDGRPAARSPAPADGRRRPRDGPAARRPARQAGLAGPDHRRRRARSSA